MRIPLVAALAAVLLCLPPPLPGQTDTAVAAAPSAKKAYDALVKQYDAAMKSYLAEVRAIAATPAYKAAAKKRDYQALRKLRSGLKPPVTKFVAHFENALEKYASEADAVYYHNWLLKMARDEKKALAHLEALETKHLQHPAIKDATAGIVRKMRVVGAPRCREFVARVIEANDDEMLVAAALYSRASLTRYDKEATDAQKKQAEADLERIQTLVPGTTLALKAAGPRFERERLQIGMVAPDIEGEDLDGVEFKLSDYRGKVVLLDFWGDW